MAIAQILHVQLHSVSQSEAQIEIYNTVRKANEDAIAAVKPGVRAMDLDKIARDVITEAGYGEYFTHRLRSRLRDFCT